MRILILGGARSGKSRYAVQMADRLWNHPLYLATAEVKDSEMAQRVKQHRQLRSNRFTCIEEPLKIEKIIRENPHQSDVILIDCITIWLSNILLKDGAEKFESHKNSLLQAIGASAQDIILVSNEVGMGIVPENKLGRMFRDFAGLLNQALAAEVETAIFLAAGFPILLKGSLPD